MLSWTLILLMRCEEVSPHSSEVSEAILILIAHLPIITCTFMTEKIKVLKILIVMYRCGDDDDSYCAANFSNNLS